MGGSRPSAVSTRPSKAKKPGDMKSRSGLVSFCSSVSTALSISETSDASAVSRV